MSLVEAEEQKRWIRALFSRIADHYDVINRLLSLGQDQRWRRMVLAAAALKEGDRMLDVATGTGDLPLLAQRWSPTPRVIGTDITLAMLRRARGKAGMDAVPLVAGDGLTLPFRDEAFDAVTSLFLMRNVPDMPQAFREQVRVAKVGARVVCLEMTWPKRIPMRWLLGIYFFGLAPLLGRVIAGAPDAYRYLPESVRRFLDPPALAEVMRQAGLREVRWRTMMLGTVMLHVGVK